MAAEGVVLPLWGKLVLISLAKKGVILTAGYLYGFPRLYRRSQKLVRYLVREPARSELQGYVRTGFRLPARLLHFDSKAPQTPALQYLSALPNRLVPSARKLLGQEKLKKANSQTKMYGRLRTTFASSALVQRQSESFAAGRAKLTSLRDKFGASAVLQNMVQGRAAHAAEMWRKVKRQPYIFVPAI